MKSIGTYVKRPLIISLFTFISVILVFISLYHAIEDYNKLLMDSTRISNGINPLFSQGIINNETIELVDTYIPGNLLGELKARNDIPALQNEARRIMKEIQDLRTQHVNTLIVYLRYGLFSMILLFLLLIILIIITNNAVHKVILTSKNMVLYFGQTILGGRDPLETSIDSHFTDFSKARHYKEIQEIEAFFQRTLDRMNLIQELLTMDLGFSIETFIDQFGNLFCSDTYQQILPCDRFSLALYEADQNLLVAYHATVRGNQPIFLQTGFCQPLSETSLRLVLEQRSPYRIINNLEERDSMSAQLLLQEGIRSNLTVPIIINERLFGFLFFAHRKADTYTDEIGNIATLISNILRSRLFYSHGIQRTLSVFGDGIVNIVEFKDDETADHTRRVSLYAELIADVLRQRGHITPQKASEIREYAPLHDIGKIGIPDTILLKPGPLSTEEWALMKQHPEIGGKLIKKANEQLIRQLGFGLLHSAYNIIVDHHEWWDGTGYPRGKKGIEISIEGQIIAIADVFDALTTRRPYKAAYPIETALAMVSEQAGTHFNPALIEIFTKKEEQIAAIYKKHYVTL